MYMTAGAVPAMNKLKPKGTMKNTMRTTIFCIACSLATAWAQQDSSTTPGSSSSSSSRQSSQYGRGSYSSSMSQGQQSLRVSQQIMNAQVKTQDGQQLGQISDLIANPQSGRLEFAVIEKGDKLCPIPFQLLSPEGAGSSSTSGTGTSSGTSSSTSSSTSRDTTPGASSTTPGASSSTTPGSSSSTSGRFGQSGQAQKVTFVARVDSQKIEQAPSFSRTQWPDISQPTWSQQIYSHYGVQPEAVGSPGSSSSGSFKSSSQGSASPGSSSTSGSSSSDSDSKSSKSKSSQDKSSQSKPSQSKNN